MHIQNNWVIKAGQLDKEKDKIQKHYDNFMKHWVDYYSQKSSKKFTTVWDKLMEDYCNQEHFTNYLHNKW